MPFQATLLRCDPKRNSQSSAASSAGTTACDYKLRWRGTFIDVDENDDIKAGFSPRARSEPGMTSGRLGDVASMFLNEQSYVNSLSENLLAVWRKNDQDKEAASSASTGVPEGRIGTWDTILETEAAVDSFPSEVGQVMDSLAVCEPAVLERSRAPHAKTIPLEPLEQAIAVDEDAIMRINREVSNQLLHAKSMEMASEPELVTLVGDSSRSFAFPTNHGSLGHPEMCTRPCLHFARGYCAKGENCDFCHLQHTARVVHLDKRNREFLRRLSIQEVASMVWPLLQKKVLAVNSSPQTLRLLSEAVAALGGDGVFEPRRFNRSNRVLSAALESMSIRGLLSVLQRSAPHGCSAGENALKEFAQHLRQMMT